MSSNPTLTLQRGSDSIDLWENPGDGYTLLHGSTGLGIAPTESTLDAIPAGHGSLLRHTRLTDREIYLPIMLDGRDMAECDRLRDRLHALLDPTQGVIRIQVQSKTRNRAPRFIEAIYSGGLEGDYDFNYTGVRQTIGLRFKAPTAFWSGDPVVKMWQIAPGVKPFLSQTRTFFPVILSSSTIGGEFFLPIEGDQPAWPVYTITGPGGDPIIERVDTGQKIAFSGQVAARKSITFDTYQGTVTSPGIPVEQLWPRVSPDSDFFPIGPGPVRLRVRFTSASEMSSLTVSYTPQYLTGY